MSDYDPPVSFSIGENLLAAETTKRRLLNDHPREVLLRDEGYSSAEFSTLDSERSLYKDMWRKIGPTRVPDIPIGRRYDMLAPINCESLISNRS